MSATSVEMQTAPATTRPNSRKKRPTTPVRKAIGMKTAQLVAVVATTASPISSVPKEAASSGAFPRSMCR